MFLVEKTERTFCLLESFISVNTILRRVELVCHKTTAKLMKFLNEEESELRGSRFRMGKSYFFSPVFLALICHASPNQLLFIVAL